MSQSLVKNYLHLVFSTKHRNTWLPVECRAKYIQNQEEHHRKVSFQDELRELFRLHEIEFDERYVWD